LDKREAFEVFSVLADWEVDLPPLLLGESGRGLASTHHYRPCKLVESTPQVVGDVTEDQAPDGRHGVDVGDDDGEAVAFWFVVSPPRSVPMASR
jgi:hypothetical protein